MGLPAIEKDLILCRFKKRWGTRGESRDMTKCGLGSRPTGVGESGVRSPAGLSGEREKEMAQWIPNI